MTVTTSTTSSNSTGAVVVPRMPPVNVLVKVHPDGYIEAFAEKHVRVRIVNVVAETFPEGDVTADEYLGNLPKCYRDLDYPSGKRATGNLRHVTFFELNKTRSKLDLIGALKKLPKLPDSLESRDERDDNENNAQDSTNDQGRC